MARLILRRRAGFCAAHAYWLPGRTDEENQALFGRWASRWGHGHNYMLEVAIGGEVDSTDGMVMNLTEIDAILKREVIALLNEKHLTYDVPYFQERPPTLENIARFVAERLEGPLTKLTRIQLWEMPTLWLTWEKENTEMILTRKLDFAASHRLHAPGLSDAENKELFGKCNNPKGHGHNYGVEVSVSGTPDPITGMLVDLEQLDAALEREVMQRFDHKNLNDDVQELSGLNPTTENLALAIWDVLKDNIPAPARLHKIVVQETERNYFEYDGK